MYSLLRRAAFTLEPERAHSVALSSIQFAHRLGLWPRQTDEPAAAVSLMGLRFANRIGLAAGFDKNGRYIDALGSLGFGFIEVGTVTPRAQAGQSKPRLFRLPRSQALINRMGFPNDGAVVAAVHLSRRKFRGVCGVNIGKNASTPLTEAVDDYVSCYRTVAPHADYVVVNVSSPNTKDLRRLQQVAHLRPILEALLRERDRQRSADPRHVPLLAKVSPDLTQEELVGIGELLVELAIDGVIAANTTIRRPEGIDDVACGEEGGLSGAPLRAFALQSIRGMRSIAGDRLPIIGVGGIGGATDARDAFDAGADLLQVYTGLIYRGPGLVRELRGVRRTT